MLRLSIILPFYKRAKEFAYALKHNEQYFKNVSEVLIVMDDPTDKDEVLKIVDKYESIHWHIILNDKPHVWRNPAKAINVGIRNCFAEFCLIMSPESILASDVPLQLFRSIRDTTKDFSIGQVTFCTYNELQAGGIKIYSKPTPFGSILCRTSILKEIRGYNEANPSWGGDDDNIRIRLQNKGMRMIRTDALVVHPCDKPRTHTPKDHNEMIKYVLTKDVLANDDNWGQDFNKIIYAS